MGWPRPAAALPAVDAILKVVPYLGRDYTGGIPLSEKVYAIEVELGVENPRELLLELRRNPRDYELRADYWKALALRELYLELLAEWDDIMAEMREAQRKAAEEKAKSRR